MTLVRRKTEAKRYPRQPGGFTAVELLVVVLVAGILGGLAFPRFARYRSQRESINARDAFGYAAARARAAAVGRGDVVVLMIRPHGDSVVVMSGDAEDTLEVIDYVRGETTADVVMAGGLPAPFRICYVPRGFAHPSCGNGDRLPVRVGFANRSDTLWSVISGVGQVQR